jgi:hypothetical protein
MVAGWSSMLVAPVLYQGGYDIMNLNCHRFLLAAFALAAMIFAPAAASAQSWTQIGALSCQVDPNVGFIIVGHQSMRCTYEPAQTNPPQGPPQFYDGALNTVGLSFGISAGSAIGWAVFAPTTGVPAGALAGEYVGVTGTAAVGVGGGANVLLGGSNRTIALQPVSLQGSVALNVVAGVSSLTLRWR